MSLRNRFEAELQRFLMQMGEGGDMGEWRTESIHAVEEGLRALGLGDVVASYLQVTFGAAALGELGDEDLATAYRFIARIQGLAPRRHTFPLSPGSVVDGRIFWVDGKVSLGT